ncbi:MAG: hypothetical protein Q4G49_09460 [Paracoccus sp. (in: a-proteobacteria)]|nr:hypothetical protein [Paracoccus sp. (in: a-proteobacteria)]
MKRIYFTGDRAAWLTASIGAAAGSLVALGISAALMDQPVWAPINATSHILNGDAAGGFRGVDLLHTGLGAAIHVVSSGFWAAVAMLWMRVGDLPGDRSVWIVGPGTAVLAFAVDYGVMPPRLTPGWELVLPPWGIAAGFAGLGLGIAAGLMLSHRSEGMRRSRR